MKLRYLCLLLWIWSAWPVAADDRSLVVQGVGETTQVPDMAIISLSVEQDARNATDAVEAVARDMRGILSGLQGLGIEGRDVQTTQLRLNPLWENRNSSSGGRPRIVGFAASSSVQLRVREIARLGDVLDAVLALGANRFSGLRFDLQDRDAALRKARRAAVRDAIAQAELLAEAAGITLGDIRTISAGTVPRGVARAEAFGAAGSVPVAPGELTISAQVSLTFDIVP